MDLQCLETRGPKLLTSSPSWPAGRWWLQGLAGFKEGRCVEVDTERFTLRKIMGCTKAHAKAAHHVLGQKGRKKSENNISCGQQASLHRLHGLHRLWTKHDRAKMEQKL